MNEDYLMISFENTHSAIQTERLLEQHFKVATMPTLRTVTHVCDVFGGFQQKCIGTF